jgi:hypothetical protein
MLQLYLAGGALLGLGWLYTQSQIPTPPPVVVRNVDSDLYSIDLMQKKQWLYGGNPSANLPIGIQNRKLPNYDGASNGSILQKLRQNYANVINDQDLIPQLVGRSVHAGQYVTPSGQNGYNTQVMMQPGAARALVVEPYSRSGYSSITTALATTAVGQPPLLRPF